MIVVPLMLTAPSWSSKTTVMSLSRNMLKRVGDSRHLSDSNCCLEPVSYAAVEEDCTSGPVIEVFDDLDKGGADDVLLHGCP